jgi:hypothetical protein
LDVSMVTSSDPINARYLTGSKSEIFARLERAFQAMRNTPEESFTPAELSKSRFLVYSIKAWKAAFGDSVIPISEIASINTGSVKGRRITLNLSDSKSRTALREAVKKNHNFEVTIGSTIYGFVINHARDGEYFAIPEDPDREKDFTYDSNTLSNGCIFFRLEGGMMDPHLYTIDHLPPSTHNSKTETSGSGAATKPLPPDSFVFDEERFRNIEVDAKGSRDHYKLALKFEICVFAQFAKMDKREFGAGMSIARIAANHTRELISIHKKVNMEDSDRLNLTIIYLSMARAFADFMGISFPEYVNAIDSAASRFDSSVRSSMEVDPRAKTCLKHLVEETDRIMGREAGRFVSEREAAIKAYKDIVEAPNSATAAFMKKHPQVAKLLVAHLITAAYSIFLAYAKDNSVRTFTTKIVSKFY